MNNSNKNKQIQWVRIVVEGEKKGWGKWVKRDSYVVMVEANILMVSML